MSVKNAKQFPKVFYGMHMEPGTAEYKDEDTGESYRIYLGEECLKRMDPTYAGKPVYVRHVDKVNLENLQAEAQGYVSESFYNPCDGKHWVKFIVVGDEAMDAVVNKKWKLSNSYKPKQLGPGGECHAVEYTNEILDGEYEHLAIVPDPRYEDSTILTPEEFKDYNEKKEIELKKLSNSKGDEPMLDFFKRSKVDNSKDMEGMSVILPKSKKEITIAKLVNDADVAEMKKDDDDDDKMANEEHHVMVGEEKMKVNELVGKHLELKEAYDALKKKNDDDDDDDVSPEEDKEAKEKALELAEHEEEEIKEKSAAKKKNSKYFTELKNAHKTADRELPVVDMSMDKVARGKSRYGSR